MPSTVVTVDEDGSTVVDVVEDTNPPIRRKNVNTMTFAQACEAWRAVAEKYVHTGACDTEPRSVFADLVNMLADGKIPEVSQKGTGWHPNESTWQLYEHKDTFFAGKALARAAERVVKVAQRVGPAEVQAYATRQGWFW